MLIALRYFVFAVFVVSALIALGSWALQERKLSPFGRLARLTRRFGDPVLGPIETWQLRRGGNPRNAHWWLLGATVAGGIVIITGAEWLIGVLGRAASAASEGPRGVTRLLLFYAGQIVLLALIIRVVGSWFGAGRFNRWIGWTYTLTDWIVLPLRRIIPPIGMFDITPLVAWFLLQFLLAAVMRVI